MSKQTTLEILKELKIYYENTIASEQIDGRESRIMSDAKEDLYEIEKAIEWVEKQ